MLFTNLNLIILSERPQNSVPIITVELVFAVQLSISIVDNNLQNIGSISSKTLRPLDWASTDR